MTEVQRNPDVYRRKVSNYIINWRYQLRFTLTIVAISASLVAALGWLIMWKVHEATRVVQVRALDPTDTLAQDLVKQFQANDRIMLYALVGFAVLFCTLVAAYGIVLTHKAAGPLHKIALQLDKMRDGKLTKPYPLRKGDQLEDFFDRFAAAHEAIRQQATRDIELLDRAIASGSPIASELTAARDAKAESLK